jgi:hypothetical protein
MAKQSDALKLAKLQLKAQREAQAWATVRTAIASPVVQLVGSVAIAEILENQGILSGKWAGALEGGVIAMVGLQALKDYGVIGASALGLGITGGGLLGEFGGMSSFDAFAQGGTTGQEANMLAKVFSKII